MTIKKTDKVKPNNPFSPEQKNFMKKERIRLSTCSGKGLIQIDYIVAIGIFIVVFAVIVQMLTNYFVTAEGTSEIETLTSSAVSFLGVADFGHEKSNQTTETSTGPNSPSTGENIDTGGLNWSSPENYIYTGFNFSVSSQEVVPTGVSYNGTRFYIVGLNSDAVYEYNTSGVYTGFNFSVAGQTTGPEDVYFNGTHFYVLSNNPDKVFEYNRTGSYTGFNFSANQDISPFGITFNGSHFYVVGDNTNRIYEYNRTGSYTGFNFSVASQDKNPEGITFNASNFYVLGRATKRVYEYNLTGSYTGLNFGVADEETLPYGIYFNGTHFYVVGESTDRVYEYARVLINVSGAVDKSDNKYAEVRLKNVTYTGFNFNMSAQDSVPEGITFNGTHFHVVGRVTDTVYEYNRTGNYTGFNFSVADQETNAQGITSNGTHFYVVGNANDTVYEYNRTGNYTGFNFSVADQDETPTGITFNGTHFHIAGDFTNKIYEYDRTGNYTGFNFSVNAQELSPDGITFDGTHFYVVGSVDDTVYEYNRTGGYTGFNFSVSSQETLPEDVTFNGTHFYVVGSGTGHVYEYKSVNETSDGLRASNFGFGVPSNATINGIKIEVERKASGSGIKDKLVRLVKAGSLAGDDKASADEWPTTDAVKTYGGQSDLWGTTWTPADINATNFGAQLEVNSSRFNRTASVDNVKITVYYSNTTEGFERIGLRTGAYRFTVAVNNTKPFYVNQSENVTDLTNELMSFDYDTLGINADVFSTYIYDGSAEVSYNINGKNITFRTSIDANEVKYLTVYFDDDSSFTSRSVSISGSNKILETFLAAVPIPVLQYKKIQELNSSNYADVKASLRRGDFHITIKDVQTNPESTFFDYGGDVPRTGNIVSVQRYFIFQNSTAGIRQGKIVVKTW